MCFMLSKFVKNVLLLNTHFCIVHIVPGWYCSFIYFYGFFLYSIKVWFVSVYHVCQLLSKHICFAIVFKFCLQDWLVTDLTQYTIFHKEEPSSKCPMFGHKNILEVRKRSAKGKRFWGEFQYQRQTGRLGQHKLVSFSIGEELTHNYCCLLTDQHSVYSHT